jgi:hypothetical protein
MVASKEPTKPKTETSRLGEVLTKVAEATAHAQILDVRMLRGFFAVERTLGEVKSGFYELGSEKQEVHRENSKLRVTISLNFRVPVPHSPEEAPPEHVVCEATFQLIYELAPTAVHVSSEAIDCFARVNGVYNAWPFWREYVQGSLLRLGLPAFPMPLLMVNKAVSLVGLDH